MGDVKKSRVVSKDVVSEHESSAVKQARRQLQRAIKLEQKRALKARDRGLKQAEKAHRKVCANIMAHFAREAHRISRKELRGERTLKALAKVVAKL